MDDKCPKYNCSIMLVLFQSSFAGIECVPMSYMFRPYVLGKSELTKSFVSIKRIKLVMYVSTSSPTLPLVITCHIIRQGIKFYVLNEFDFVIQKRLRWTCLKIIYKAMETVKWDKNSRLVDSLLERVLIGLLQEKLYEDTIFLFPFIVLKCE